MLSESLVGNTVLYLEQLLGSGRMLSAVANSPLAGIAATCGSVQLRQTDLVKTTDDKLCLEHITYKAIGASNSFNPAIQQGSDHDVYLDRAVELAADTIQRNMTLTRTVIRPLVSDTVEAVTAALQNFNNVTFKTPIIPDKVLSVFDHPYVQEMVENYTQNIYYQDLPFINTFPALDASAIQELIPSLNSDLDKRVVELTDALGAEKVIATYVSAFVDGSLATKMVTRNEYILVMLIASQLLLVKPASVAPQVTEFFDKVTTLRNQVALRIKNDIARWKAAYEANNLIISYPARIAAGEEAKGDPIVVHDELYEEWLHAGGEPDMIYGAFFSDRPMNGQVILTERSKYLWEAKNYLQQLEAANESKRSSVIRRVIRESLVDYLNKDASSEEAKFNERHATLIHNALNNATALDLNDVLGYVTLLVCNSLYPESYAKKIIDGFNHYQLQYPAAVPEDLATLVISDILVEWVANMCLIQPIGQR